MVLSFSALKRCTTLRNVKVSSSSEFRFPCLSLSISSITPLPIYSQGYAFKVITSLEGLNQLDNLVYPTKAEQIELLQSVLLASESDADLGTDVSAKKDDLAGTITSKSFGGPSAANGGGGRKDGAGQATRVAGSLQALSGWVLALSQRDCFTLLMKWFIGSTVVNLWLTLNDRNQQTNNLRKIRQRTVIHCSGRGTRLQRSARRTEPRVSTCLCIE